MNTNTLERRLAEKISPSLKDVTPGLLVRCYQAGKLILDLSIGQTYSHYDLASLTKIIFTVQGMMECFDAGKWNLETRIHDILTWFPHKHVRICDLLTHTSGFVWWLPVYEELSKIESWEAKRNKLKEVLTAQNLVNEGKCVYSDVGFWALSFVLEEMYEKPLLDVWKHIQSEFYGGTTFNFHLNNKPLQQQNYYAPTEQSALRGHLLQGEVHDDNCWSMGGVSTHAGLFGSIDDVGWFSLHLRSQLMGIARYKIKQKTAILFAKRAIPESKGDFALGFMLPTPGSSSTGYYFSRNAIGHTGFTGTSIWYDSSQDLSIAMLSNRVLYGRENNGFKDLRPQIHNWIIEGLRRSGV